MNNRRLILEVFRRNGTVTIGQIVDHTGLSKTTVWKLIDQFQTENLILDAGKGGSSEEGGKKPGLFVFNKDFGYLITMVIRGTYILLGLTDARAEIFYKEKIAIREDSPLDDILSIVTKFITDWQNTDKSPIRSGSVLLGIALGAFGVIDTRQGRCLTASRFASWETDAPIRSWIENQVDIAVPFYIDNSNRYYTLAEKAFGCAQKYDCIVGLVPLSDGLGAGIIEGGGLRHGHRFLAGEVGHIRVDPEHNGHCHCGGRGCLEQMVSLENVQENFERRLPSHQVSKLNGVPPLELTYQDVFDAANGGDALARDLVDDLVKWLAIGISNINLVLNPELVVVAGDFRSAGEYFLNNLRERVEKLSLTRMEKGIRISYASFDEDAPLIGGAAYILQEFFDGGMENG